MESNWEHVSNNNIEEGGDGIAGVGVFGRILKENKI